LGARPLACPLGAYTGEGGAASAFACHPCTRTGGRLGFGRAPPRLPPWRIHGGMGAPLPCLRLPFASPLHPNPGGRSRFGRAPGSLVRLAHKGGHAPSLPRTPPFACCPYVQTGAGRKGGPRLRVASARRPGRRGGAPLLGVAPATRHARVAFGGRGVRKGEGSPFPFPCGDTKRGGEPPPALATPPPRFPRHPCSVHVANKEWGVCGQAGGGGRT